MPKNLDLNLDTDQMLVAEKIENLSLVDLDVIDMQDSTDLLNEITYLLPSVVETLKRDRMINLICT